MTTQITGVPTHASTSTPTSDTSAAVAPVPSAVPLPTSSPWLVVEHLSPLAAFEPGRVDICTRYQLAAVDHSSTAAHLDAALHHLRAAADRVNGEDGSRTLSVLRQAEAELRRVADCVGLSRGLAR